LAASCHKRSLGFRGHCIARPRGLPPAKRTERGRQVSLWIELDARCALPPALARCEGIHIAFSRQQEFQEAYVSDTTGLINAQQYQMLGKPSFFDISSDIFPVITDTLDRVLGQIVVPGHAVMLQEREQALAIAEDTLLQGLGGIGFVDAVRERIEECRHVPSVTLQALALKAMLVDRDDD
jgi:hypothetical protein